MDPLYLGRRRILAGGDSLPDTRRLALFGRLVQGAALRWSWVTTANMDLKEKGPGALVWRPVSVLEDCSTLEIVTLARVTVRSAPLYEMPAESARDWP